MKHIISASRRTDIPAFFTPWLIKRLAAGSVLVKNPYSGKTSEVSLRPEAVHSIVLWSKDFGPLLERIEEVERHARALFFHFTITGIPKELELRTPETRKAVEDFKFIAKRYSPGHIIWRFDPVVITDLLPFEAYEESFAYLASALKGHAAECYFSFMEPYKKVLRSFGKYSGQKLAVLSAEEKQRYSGRLSAIAEKCGLRLSACCNEYLVGGDIERARCIDAERLAGIFNDVDISTKPAPTREGCGCARAVDIGAYDTCAHGCLYCYANSDKEKAQRFLERFDPEQRGLGFDAENKDGEPF